MVLTTTLLSRAAPYSGAFLFAFLTPATRKRVNKLF